LVAVVSTYVVVTELVKARTPTLITGAGRSAV
jgi:hypothetical protein